MSYIEPLAAGSGIPELKTYLNGVRLPGLLRLQTIITKLGGIVFTISSGLIAGKVISTHLLRYHFTGLCFLRFGIHFGTGGAFCMTGRSICTWRRDCWERN